MKITTVLAFSCVTLSLASAASRLARSPDIRHQSPPDIRHRAPPDTRQRPADSEVPASGARPSRPATARPGLFVIDGEDAERGEFPWMTQLKRDGAHICGGVLVSKSWLLTAAHCLAKNPDVAAYQVILGEYNVSVEEGSEQRRSVTKIQLYSDSLGHHLGRRGGYGSRGLPNDIALFRLDQPAIYTQWVQSIVLPNPSDDFTGRTATASGWGASGSTSVGPVFPDVLQKMPLTLLADDVCLRDLVFFNYAPETMSCAAAAQERSSLCWGDSGGSLTLPGPDGRPLLVGVTSWGVDCDLTKLPTVFVEVAAFAKWVRSVIGAEVA